MGDSAGGGVAASVAILARSADDVVAGRLRPIVTTTLRGLTPETMRTAHTLVETRRTIGKTVITF
jgi:NADPH:quinone reductase-like Zn-dependent oxidoreductase